MNDLTTTPQSAQLPAHLQARAGQSNALVDDLMGGLPQGFPKISVKGKFFSSIINKVVHPLGHTIDVVIVGGAKGLNKAFFRNTFVDGVDAEPDCASDEGEYPNEEHKDVFPPGQYPGYEMVHNGSCQTCPMNAWGSEGILRGTASEGKACKDRKTIAIMNAADLSGSVYSLQLPPTSLKALAGLMKAFKQYNAQPQWMVVRLSFEHASSYPNIIFDIVSWLTPEKQATIDAVIDGGEVERMLNRSKTVAPTATEGAGAPQVQDTVQAAPPMPTPTAPTAPVQTAPPTMPTPTAPTAPVQTAPPTMPAPTPAPTAPVQTAPPTMPTPNPDLATLDANIAANPNPEVPRELTRGEKAAATRKANKLKKEREEQERQALAEELVPSDTRPLPPSGNTTPAPAPTPVPPTPQVQQVPTPTPPTPLTPTPNAPTGTVVVANGVEAGEAIDDVLAAQAGEDAPVVMDAPLYEVPSAVQARQEASPPMPTPTQAPAPTPPPMPTPVPTPAPAPATGLEDDEIPF